ncbi:hypothetical protein QFC21_003227 [Naganishia friedmannii]|uniref:Uncharacterized protein n=1 Tax=Naganishia friedmannii TaxID=89922 RepID=A0ACC2VRC6_9TREE|nr:hypothetical protein QFC21_003227 [Naganishia friedmannii]
MAFSTYFTVEKGQYEGSLSPLLARQHGGKMKGEDGASAEKTEKDVFIYTSDIAQRFFCSHCGTPILMRYFCTSSTLHVPLGLLDIPAQSTSTSSEVKRLVEEFREAYKPRQDIWVSSRACTDGEGREQFEEDDRDFLEKCQQWREREQK